MSDQAVQHQVDSNFEQFGHLLAAAQRHEHRGDDESAAGYAQAAAEQAWLNPGGVFASPELESMLGRIGRRLPSAGTAADVKRGVRRVLHVVTQAYQTGGSTQFVVSWLEQDIERCHSVCLTRQRTVPIPEKIKARLGSRAGLIRLDDRRGSLLRRAALLRQLSTGFDVVLVHAHPYDVVPVLAFAGQSGCPPIIYVNHADHVFWVGTSVADLLFNMRVSGAELAVRRRGIEQRRSTLMYRPLQLSGRTVTRAEAKRALGIPVDQLLIVTAADAAKYSPISGPSLLAMVLPLFESDERLSLMAAGPAPDGEWADAAARTDGRVRGMGLLSDVSTLHQAADLYLDSFPFSSLTSMMEAGSLGTPVVTYRGHPESCAVLGADTHGLDELMQSARDPVALRVKLKALLDDHELRASLGERTRTAIVESHTGAGWRRAVDDLYRSAAAVGKDPQPMPTLRQNTSLDQLLQMVMARTPFSAGAGGAVLDNLGLLPVRTRLGAAARLVRSAHRPTAKQLLPEWSVPRLAELARRTLRRGR